MTINLYNKNFNEYKNTNENKKEYSLIEIEEIINIYNIYSEEDDIWGVDLIIAHIRKTFIYFIDSICYKPPCINQFFIIMFKDIINNEKYQGFFIKMNNRTKIIYEKILSFIYNMLTHNNLIEISLKIIITDTEMALINAIEKFFQK